MASQSVKRLIYYALFCGTNHPAANIWAQVIADLATFYRKRSYVYALRLLINK